MAMTKRSIVVDEELVAEALRRAGPRGFSRLVNEALRLYLQRQGIEELEAEFAREHGPIPPDIMAWAEQIEWPR